MTALAGELGIVGDGFQPPSTPTERRLAAVWAAVLGIPQDQIDRRDHFFDRGGTSLSAVTLAITLDHAVSLTDVTRHPILADLAGALDGLSLIHMCIRDSTGSHFQQQLKGHQDVVLIPGVAARRGPMPR